MDRTAALATRRCLGFFGAAAGAVALPLLLVTAPTHAGTEAPSQAIVERVLKTNLRIGRFATLPRATDAEATNFGKTYRPRCRRSSGGLPKAPVVLAVVDFSVRTYNTGETHVLRRVRDATVYKDKMDEWVVMTGSARGADVATVEPKSP